MRRTTHIQKTSFLLSGADLNRVLIDGIKLQTEGEFLGSLTAVIIVSENPPHLEATFEKAIES